MAGLAYKLEYFKGADGASDEGVYIQMRSDVSSYLKLISKEAYLRGDGVGSDLATSLFAIPGVVRLALQAHRVYIEKSPVYSWSEILGPAMALLQGDTNTDSLIELPGSGVTLDTADDRRAFS